MCVLFVGAGGRIVGENKALTSKKSRMNPQMKGFEKCRICKTSVHQVGSHYCQGCAYKKGTRMSLMLLLTGEVVSTGENDRVNPGS